MFAGGSERLGRGEVRRVLIQGRWRNEVCVEWAMGVG